MIKRLKIRRVPRRKRGGKMTGVIYLHGHVFGSTSVVVMEQAHYDRLRKQIVAATKRLVKIKRIAGFLKADWPNIRKG